MQRVVVAAVTTKQLCCAANVQKLRKQLAFLSWTRVSRRKNLDITAKTIHRLCSRTSSFFFLAIFLCLSSCLGMGCNYMREIRITNGAEAESGLKRALGFVSPRLHYHQVAEAGKALSTRTRIFTSLPSFSPSPPSASSVCV